MRAIVFLAVLTAAATGVAMGTWEALHTRVRCAPTGSCGLVHPRATEGAATSSRRPPSACGVCGPGGRQAIVSVPFM
ncbi:MAG: hypothetical protein E6I76_00235 [Chloroflexi bacterium]|nr:MAG: hypothetical protein E6I76_00235 [Chloroflexota bacterium]